MFLNEITIQDCMQQFEKGYYIIISAGEIKGFRKENNSSEVEN